LLQKAPDIAPLIGAVAKASRSVDPAAQPQGHRYDRWRPWARGAVIERPYRVEADDEADGT
jgi:hypothetical protein